MYELTPKQIKEIDEIMLDKNVTDNTLNVALNYHSNRMNSLIKKEKEWWDDVTNIYNLDRNKKWRVNFNGPVILIEEVPKKE